MSPERSYLNMPFLRLFSLSGQVLLSRHACDDASTENVAMPCPELRVRLAVVRYPKLGGSLLLTIVFAQTTVATTIILPEVIFELPF
jgi:hypothetical protein